MPSIDIKDLRENTEYRGMNREDKVIEWFWDVVTNMDAEEKALLLQFVTGTSKVPIGGFANLPGMHGIQKFCITNAGSNDNSLPVAHTCFNQLDLPTYSSKNILSQKLKIAIRECSQGFGFA